MNRSMVPIEVLNQGSDRGAESGSNSWVPIEVLNRGSDRGAESVRVGY